MVKENLKNLVISGYYVMMKKQIYAPHKLISKERYSIQESYNYLKPTPLTYLESKSEIFIQKEIYVTSQYYHGYIYAIIFIQNLKQHCIEIKFLNLSKLILFCSFCKIEEEIILH